MLIVNGPPKAGCHAMAAVLSRVGAERCPGTILACTWDQAPHVAGAPSMTLDAMRLMPDNIYTIAHVCAQQAAVLRDCPVITVLRDPRNCLISYQRHRKRVDGLELTTAESLADYWGAPFVQVYRGFFGWRSKAMIVRYEDLPASVTGDGANIYCRHDAQHNTRTGSPSDWTETWSSVDHRAFRDAGGRELLAEAGYG